MRRDSLISAFVALTAVTVALVAVLLVSDGRRTVVREPVQTTVVEPSLTPLPRDSGPKNNLARPSTRQPGRSAARGRPPPAGGPTAQSPTAGARNRPLPSSRRKSARTTPERRRAPRRPKQPAQPPPPPPPVVGVKVPVPVTVCTQPVGVNCP